MVAAPRPRTSRRTAGVIVSLSLALVLVAVACEPTTPTPTTTTTTRPATTTTRPATTTTRPTTTTTTTPSSAHFGTLSPTATLPTGAVCAGKVRAAAESRPANATANHTKGKQKNLTAPYPDYSRVDGNYTGTTDQIIQWASCKWGIDEDIVRAQVGIESWWYQSTVGDFTTNSAVCIPGHGIGADGHAGQCPQSGGLLALTYQYYANGFPEAMTSSAYNLDYVLAMWHSCYTGKVTWLNTVERGSTYAAGDAWGCVGFWFAGRWHTQAADDYVTRVKSYLSQKIWTTSGFLAG